MTKPSDYPYFEISCAFCSNKIYIPSGTFVSCVTCKNKICVNCAPEILKMYGNKHYYACALLCNHCHECCSDNELSDVSSDSDSDDELTESEKLE